MTTRIFLLLSVLFTSYIASAQIKGTIIDDQKRPVPYANVFNHTLNQGTISNNDGYFELSTSSANDSVTVSFVGYETATIPLSSGQTTYTIQLVSKATILDEITIKPKDNRYLADLLVKCRKSRSKDYLKARGYYDLKSFAENQQIELVEGYYNLEIQGYELQDMDLKTGRLAAQSYDNRYFASMESSKALTDLQLFDQYRWFPETPFTLSSKKIMKYYYLEKAGSYLDEDNDSLYVVRFSPKKTAPPVFGGQAWIKKDKEELVKVKLDCKNCSLHPFLPLFPSDSLESVSLYITKTYQNGVFQHTDFSYDIKYKSRSGQEYEKSYNIHTRAVLYAYKFNDPFFQPRFEFSKGVRGEYRKINAMPFNEFFWTNHDEYDMNDAAQKNDLFYKDPRSLTDQTIFKNDVVSVNKKGLYQAPYAKWSKTRIVTGNVIQDTIAKPQQSAIPADNYNLSVKVFFDYSSYNDSLNVLTATIFDPYESYFRLPIDHHVNCFINIYFDLTEIKRRAFMDEIKGIKDEKVIYARYKKFQADLDEYQYQYIKDVDRGSNMELLREYNAIVKKELGIDNIGLFRLE